MNKSKYNSHTNPIFKKLNILKFNDMFDLNCKLFMHSLFTINFPPALKVCLKSPIL